MSEPHRVWQLFSEVGPPQMNGQPNYAAVSPEYRQLALAQQAKIIAERNRHSSRPSSLTIRTRLVSEWEDHQ